MQIPTKIADSIKKVHTIFLTAETIFEAHSLSGHSPDPHHSTDFDSHSQKIRAWLWLDAFSRWI